MAKKRKKSKIKKRIIQALVLLALVAILVWVFVPGAVVVETEEAHIGSFYSIVEANGVTRARDKYVIWAPIAGSVQRTSVAGDPVVRDQVLARIIPNPDALADAATLQQLNERIGKAETAKAQAVAERVKVMADLDTARDSLRETEQRAALGTASVDERDMAQTRMKFAFKQLEAAGNAIRNADFDLAAARSALAQAKLGAGKAPWLVRAPVDGIVLTTASGSKTSLGAPLLAIGNPKDLDVVVSLPAGTATQIQPGQQVRVQADADAPLQGRVRRIDPAVAAETPAGAEQQAVNVVIDFASPAREWQTLGDGHEVKVRITASTLDNVLKVPATALFADGANTAVFVASQGKAHKRIVTVRARDALEAVVGSGLRENERVILSPGEKIKDGVRVKTR